MSPTQLSLTAADVGVELTREEFAEAEFAEGCRFERFRGRLVIMSPPGIEHINSSDPIRDALVVYKVAHPDLVEYVIQEAWTIVSDDTDRRPDLGVYLRDDRDHAEYPNRAPELIFEIVSAGWENRRRDYEQKRNEYERIGVLEYVIVDRFDHRVTVLRLVEGKYHEQILKPSDTYRTSLLPGLEIPLQPVIG